MTDKEAIAKASAGFQMGAHSIEVAVQHLKAGDQSVMVILEQLIGEMRKQAEELKDMIA